MEAVQPDLFGEYDAAQERATLWDQPHTCPSCGTTEPNAFALSNDHGYDPGEDGICGWPRFEHPIFGRRCVAQDLVRNHIIYAVRNNATWLNQDLTRGRELGLDVDAIVAEAKEGQ